MRIQHNIMAMNAYTQYNKNTKALAGNLEKLSSGYKINRAGDDAAGLAISEKMRAQITGLDAAQKNVKDGISLVKTAEGAMQEIHDMLNKMDYLATQSANGTYQDEVDRENLQKEVESLKSEINRIADSSNFNGIKLLDGSLAKEQVATKIEIGGNAIKYKSAGSKAAYEMNAAFTAPVTALDEDGTYEFNVGFTDGTSTTVKLIVADDGNNGLKKLVSEDGKREYTLAADGKPSQAELGTAIEGELKATALADEFDIKVDSGKVIMTAKEIGTDGRQVGSFGLVGRKADGTQIDNDKQKYDVKATAGVDDGIEIKAADLTEYNGTNYDDAVFTINGKKFVLMTETHDGSVLNDPALKDNTEAMHAAYGLSSDVTILIGGTAGLIDGDDNFAQNIKKIAEVTGLNVTAGVDESGHNPTGTDTGASPTDGIRLSLGGKATKGTGLTLQIGDTADSYNQMTVSIGDMHTKGMGIDGIDIGTQGGAQVAIQTIKDAINYVSSVRGDLGAIQNRLDHTANNLAVMQENIQDAESTIRDTDVANEMMKYVKNNILVQSSQAMLAQANQVPQGVLQLLG